MSNLFSIVKNASHFVDQHSKVKNRRTVAAVLASSMAEMGELAEEVAIKDGFCYKQPGKDGVVGEAIDVIVCLLDLIHVENPTMTEEQLNQIAATKVQKWMDKTSQG